MKRATMADVARVAGVGIATVDRVLNNRAPVSEKRALRVLKAAERVDYHAQGLLRRRIEEMAPVRKLGFVLQNQEKWFYRTLGAALSERAAELRDIQATVEIEFVKRLSPDDLASAIAGLRGRVDAVGVVAIDHPLVHRAISDSARNSVPVFSMLSRINSPDIAGYIGIDGRAAGRTAGWMMARCVREPGQIGILIGSHRYIGQEDRETGFRSYMREHAPDRRLRDSFVYLDDAHVAYEAASEIIDAVPDLAGIYHCGGGVSGVVRALRESGKDTVYICHEITPVARNALRDGLIDLILSTPVEEVAKHAVECMRTAILGRPVTQTHLEFEIYTSENIY